MSPEAAARPAWRPGHGVPLTFLGTFAVVVAAGMAYLANEKPVYVLGITGLCVFLFFPRVCRLVFVGTIAIGPMFNPPVVGLGSGRVYVVQILMVCTFLGAISVAARSGLHGPATQVLVLTVLLIGVETVGRADSGLAWVYRPLQVFFVAFTVVALFRHHAPRPLVLALAWGSTIGCTAASVNALFPAFDPFRFSRPSDLPFVSAIGGFARATGAFTYPNNLGTYGAYAVIFGASAWLFGRPDLPRKLAVAVMASGASALLLAGSRAAGLGLTCAILYLTYRAAPGRRVVLIGAEVVVGLIVVTAVLSSPTAREITDQRVQSATGISLTGRIDDWRGSLREFRKSPLIGTGASESRTDNFWLLYLAQAGAAGIVILAALARVTFALHPGRARELAPEMRAGLLLALCVSGLLQDSLGQTLTTWFLGALIGVALLDPAPPAPEPAVADLLAAVGP